MMQLLHMIQSVNAAYEVEHLGMDTNVGRDAIAFLIRSNTEHSQQAISTLSSIDKLDEHEWAMQA